MCGDSPVWFVSVFVMLAYIYCTYVPLVAVPHFSVCPCARLSRPSIDSPVSLLLLLAIVPRIGFVFVAVSAKRVLLPFFVLMPSVASSCSRGAFEERQGDESCSGWRGVGAGIFAV